MKIKLRNYFVLLATVSMFTLVFASCSKEEMDQAGGGTGGTGGKPETAKKVFLPDSVIVAKSDSIV